LNQKISFEIEKAEILEENEDSQFATARIEAFGSGWNRHSLECSLEILKKTASTIYEKPLIWEYDRKLDDFGTHSERTIPAGFVVKDSAEFIEKEDGRTMLSISAKIWKRYSGKFLEILAKDEGKKKVSVEMELYEYEEREDGVSEILDFAYTAICILGEYFTEALPGANLEMLTFELGEVEKEYNRDYSKEFYSGINLSIPEDIKENAVEGLKFNKEHNTGTSVALTVAKHLANDSHTTPAKIRLMQNHNSTKRINFEDIVFTEEILLLWGGESAIEWVENIFEQIEKADHENKDGRRLKEKQKSGKEKMAMKDLKTKDQEDPTEEPITVAEDVTMSDETENVEDVEMAEDKEKGKDKEGKDKDKPEEDEAEDKDMATEEDEDKKDDKESFEDDKDAGFSLDANADVSATLAMLEEETDAYRAFASEFAKPHEDRDYSMAFDYMFARVYSLMSAMKEMEASNKAYMAENEELKSYKAEIEGEKFAVAIEDTLREITERVTIPEEEIQSLREKAQEFSLENIQPWENLVKAIAFNYAEKKSEESEDSSEIKEPKAGMPWATKTERNAQSAW